MGDWNKLIYWIKNKTSKNIVLNEDGNTFFLYQKNSDNYQDQLFISYLTKQMKKLKELKFIQISKLTDEEYNNLILQREYEKQGG